MKTTLALLLMMALTAVPLVGGAAEQPPPVPAQEQPEVLTSGPVHEAFAEPVDLQVQKGLVAPTEPPPDIDEEPPAERPAGWQFLWVPGYWAWDLERNTYIWVSGCWRAAPPNTYWVPGYWFKSAGGWEWVPGFWAPLVSARQIEYLPAPPPINDVGPPGPPPTPDNIWVPPCWYWVNGEYVRRPGYWVAAQADWVWVPSHYVWTPRGYVFVPGRWDYSLSRRGVLFAPVYFPRSVHIRAGFSYPLSIVVNFGMLQFSLFTCPRYSHFYFGDYYDNVYIRLGIFPRYECERRHTWYDPIYEHDRWRHRRSEPDWGRYERQQYDRRRNDRALRPPRTYRELEAREARMPASQRGSMRFAGPLSTFATEERGTYKFKEARTSAREQVSRQATELHKFGEERSRWESPSGRRQPAGSPTGRERPTTSQAERRESVTSPPERRGPATSPSERRQSVTPAPERRRQATSPSGHKEQGTSSAERGPEFVPPRDVHLKTPERVSIPAPPISNRERGLGIFRKTPPSRPSDERRTEVRKTPGRNDVQKDRR